MTNEVRAAVVSGAFGFVGALSAVLLTSWFELVKVQILPKEYEVFEVANSNDDTDGYNYQIAVCPENTTMLGGRFDSLGF